MQSLSWALLAVTLFGGTTQEFTVALAPQLPESVVDLVRIVAVSDVELSTSVSPRGGIALFDLTTDKAWRVTCESSELWCPEIEVSAGSAERRIQLPVMKRALLRGKLRAAHPAEPPTILQLQAWAYMEGASQPLNFHLAVPVESGRFEFPAPALTLDLRIAGEGFSPVYLWDIVAQGKSTIALGSITLRRGNSLCGFVHDGASGLPLESAQVALRVPNPTIGSPAESARRLQRMNWATKTDARGFYQIIGPPDGNYRLEVKSSNPKHQVLVVESVGILAGAETCLEDLAVKQAIEVNFSVSPAKDPAGEPWLVRLHPDDSAGFVEPPSSVPLDDAGRVSFRVSPGVHSLSVFGERTGVSLLNQSMTLENSEDIPFALSIVEVKGSVRLGEEPLVAQIRLWVVDGAFTTLESDYEGNFSGWIRDPGEVSLMAEVKAAYPAFSRWLKLDDLPIEDGALQLKFNFEDRSLEGKVTDEEGTPVRKARVSAVPVGSNMAIKNETGVDGRFLLTGLAEKPYLLRARDRDLGTSETVRVDPWGDGAGPELTLVLRRGRLMHGRLLSAALEPIPGARVTLLVPGRITSTSSGMDGRFELRTPEGSRQAVVQIFAASQVLWSACIELPGDESELTLRLPPLPGGQINVRIPRDKPMGPDRQIMLLSSDRGFFVLNTLGNWARLSSSHETARSSKEEGRTIGIPNLAAGFYTVITTPGGSMDLIGRSCAGAFSAADWQHLTPGGELSLTAVE